MFARFAILIIVTIQTSVQHNAGRRQNSLKPSQTSVASQDCYEDGVDYQGQDQYYYDNVHTAYECGQLCLALDSCLVWTWVAKPVNGQPAGRCFLKNKIPKKSNLDGVVSAMRSCTVKGASLITNNSCMEDNIDYKGNTIDVRDNVPSPAACQDLCEKNDLCHLWSWVGHTVNKWVGYTVTVTAQKCHLKNKSAESSRRSLPRVISGKKNCIERSDPEPIVRDFKDELVNKFDQYMDAKIEAFEKQVVGRWPQGSYCILSQNKTNCPTGFNQTDFPFFPDSIFLCCKSE